MLEAEVEGLDVVAGAELVGGAFEHDAPVLDNGGAIGKAERHRRVLLGDKDRQALGTVERAEPEEDVLDDQRREAHRRFVEDEEARARHQRAADRRHLLLAAGGEAGDGATLVSKVREEVVDALEVAPDIGRTSSRDRARQS